MRLKWSHLAAFGNTLLARSTIFLTVIAQYVFYSREYLRDHWGLSSAIWLYWSLLLIAIGQVLFFVYSPRPMKKYGDDVEHFVEQSLVSWSPKRISEIALEYVRSFYSRWGDGPISILDQKDNYETGHISQIIEQSMSQGFGNENNRDRIRTLLIRTFEPRPYRPHQSGGLRPSRENVLRVVEMLKGRSLSDAELVVFNEFYEFRSLNDSSNEWKIQSLEWHFDRENCSKTNAKIACALFYAAGLMYFVWNTALNIMKMTTQTADILFFTK